MINSICRVAAGEPDIVDADEDESFGMLAAVAFEDIAALPLPGQLYDKVLVDAECTHDGSLKHIIKYQKWGWLTFEKRVLNPKRLKILASLQRALLLNGFRLLKPGGTLIYSTCSFCRAQNEDVVRWLLDAFPQDAEPQPFNATERQALGNPCDGLLPGTLRFDPRTTHSSGLFIAKLHKQVAASPSSWSSAVFGSV